jgi:hypothetical protein
MTEQAVNFSAPLQKIKGEIDYLDIEIKNCADEMEHLREYKDKFFGMKEKRKVLQKQKRDRLSTLKILASFYKEATGEDADGMYPLLAKENLFG